LRRLRARLSPVLGDLTPESAALLLAVGLILGTFPVYGCPTFLCLAAAFLLRLNAPALQVVSQASTPLQILLLMPHLKLGAWILGQSAETGAAQLASAFTLRAVTGWLCLAAPLGVLLYTVLSYLLRRLRRQTGCEVSLAGCETQPAD
jgi:uncharacterized protein (DUF2062 family)